LQNNVARQAQRLRLFEVGLCFRPDGPTGNGALEQELTVGGLLWGDSEPEGWSAKARGVDFFDAKGDVERLLQMLGVSSARGAQVEFVKGSHPVYHPGQYAELIEHSGDATRVIGRVGRLHPEVEERMGTNSPAYAFELLADAVLHNQKPTYTSVSKFPSVRRDLAIVVQDTVTAGTIEGICRAAVGENLVDFTFFDVYVGKGIDSNEKSVAIGLTLQAPSATLTDAEIGRFMQRVIDALADQAGARLR